MNTTNHVTTSTSSSYKKYQFSLQSGAYHTESLIQLAKIVVICLIVFLSDNDCDEKRRRTMLRPFKSLTKKDKTFIKAFIEECELNGHISLTEIGLWYGDKTLLFFDKKEFDEHQQDMEKCANTPASEQVVKYSSLSKFDPDFFSEIESVISAYLEPFAISFSIDEPLYDWVERVQEERANKILSSVLGNDLS
jgi:hypothetical protein